MSMELWKITGAGGVDSIYDDCVSDLEKRIRAGLLFKTKDDAMRFAHLVNELALKFKKQLQSEEPNI